jgi:hypothetical protein
MPPTMQVFCRIDYRLAQRFSDHAPLTIDYDFSL